MQRAGCHDDTPPFLRCEKMVARNDLAHEKICARRAQKTLAIYRTIAGTRLIPYFGERTLDAIRSCDVEDFMAEMLGVCSPAYGNNCMNSSRTWRTADTMPHSNE